MKKGLSRNSRTYGVHAEGATQANSSYCVACPPNSAEIKAVCPRVIDELGMNADDLVSQDDVLSWRRSHRERRERLESSVS